VQRHSTSTKAGKLLNLLAFFWSGERNQLYLLLCGAA